MNMIIALFSLLALYFSITGWGTWMKFFLSIKNNSVSISCILGLALLNIVSGSLAFFTALNTQVEFLLLFFSIIPFFWKKTKPYIVYIPLSILKSAWFWSFGLLLILVCSYYSFRTDHFEYYVPTLNWLNQYGLIRGVANIHWFLGQMSSLHIIQASFDNTIDPFLRINIFIGITYLIYIFERRAYLLLLFIPFYFLYIQDPSPDILVIFFSLLVVNEVCFNSSKSNFRTLFLISIFIFTVKPIAFWLPLWVLILGFRQNKKEILCYKNYIIPVLLVFLYILKNITTSSTLFFPVTFTKINTYWLTDPRILSISAREASHYTFGHHFSPETINSFSFTEKIYYWLSQTYINSFIIISLFAFGIFSCFKKKFIFFTLWGIVLCKVILIYNFSGQFRFMLDGILPLLFVMLHSIKISRKILLPCILGFHLSAFTLLSFPVLITTFFPGFRLTSLIKGFTPGALIKPEKYIMEKYKKERLGNLNFYVSTEYVYTFDTPAPAFEVQTLQLYYDLNIFPQMKNPSNIREGFYMKSLFEKEKNKLSIIISELKVYKK